MDPSTTLSAFTASATAGPGLAQFNGVAYRAKLAVYDFAGSHQEKFRLPDDTRSVYYEHSYSLGARLSSNSWGDARGEYDVWAREVDAFAHAHPDYLFLFAASNNGMAGSRTGRFLLLLCVSPEGWIRLGFAVGVCCCWHQCMYWAVF